MTDRKFGIRSFARVLIPLLLALSVIAPAMDNRASASASLHFLFGSGSATGGKTVNFRVELTEPAPTGGAVVTLTSDNPAIPMPATVTVAAGQTERSFGVGTVPVTVDTNVTVSASYLGVTRSRVVLIREPVLSSLSVQTVIRAGGNGKIIVRLSGRAPAGGIVVNVNSNRPSIIASPGNQTILAGDAGITLIVPAAFVTQNDVPINITARYDGVTITQPTIVRFFPDTATPTATATTEAPTATGTAEVPTETATDVATATETTEPATATATDVPPTATATEDFPATATEAANQTATANANASATESANQTATADANASATEAANQTATANANASATESANQTATADANASATEAANQTSTAAANETASAISYEATQTSIAGDITQTAIAAENAATQTQVAAEAALTQTAQANEATGTAIAIETEIQSGIETSVAGTATQQANETATAIVNETSTAAANQTATANANASATEAANQTSTAAANETATESAIQTATANANASATEAANQTATESANQTATANANASATEAANQTATANANASATQAANDATSTAIAALTATATSEPLVWTVTRVGTGSVPDESSVSFDVCRSGYLGADVTLYLRSSSTSVARVTVPAVGGTGTGQNREITFTTAGALCQTAELSSVGLNVFGTAQLRLYADNLSTSGTAMDYLAQSALVTFLNVDYTATAAVATGTAAAIETATQAVIDATSTAIANETATQISAETTLTAIANETSTAAAEQTATQAAIETSTAAANATGTAGVIATGTAIANVTSTAIANATGTSVAATATAVAGATQTATAAPLVWSITRVGSGDVANNGSATFNVCKSGYLGANTTIYLRSSSTSIARVTTPNSGGSPEGQNRSLIFTAGYGDSCQTAVLSSGHPGDQNGNARLSIYSSNSSNDGTSATNRLAQGPNVNFLD